MRLQEDARLGSGARNVAAWKTGDEFSLHQPGDVPAVSRTGKTILGEFVLHGLQPRQLRLSSKLKKLSMDAVSATQLYQSDGNSVIL